MKWCTFFIVLSIFASARLALGSSPDTLKDTFDLMGGTAGVPTFGWNGEGWRDTGWCGDTLKRDTLLTITPLLSDTNIVYDTQKTISSTVLSCTAADFTSNDSNGFYPGAAYINYYYKFRHWWAQLPLAWTNWQGYDSTLLSPYKYFMIVYEGLLPVHQASLSFFYGTWGMDSATRVDDSLKNLRGAGDGLLTLNPSPTWKTVIIKIPDSVSTARIDGLTIAIGNQTNMGDSTSAVGNLKVARIALLASAEIPVRYRSNPQKALNNRFIFTPAGKNVTITAYSLKGEALLSKKVIVQAGKCYSISQFVHRAIGISAAQVRMVKIKGEGVNVTTRTW